MKRKLMALLCLLVSFGAFAADRQVCSTCPYTSLQDAIDEAQRGDTITLMDAVHTEANIEIVGKEFLEIRGMGMDQTALQPTEIPGYATQSVIRMGNSIGITIKDMTLRWGISRNKDGGGIYISSAESIQLENLRITSNTADGFGGGVFAGVIMGFEMNNCVVQYNQGRRGGGGIFLSTISSGDIVASTIRGNSAASGNTYANGGGLFSGESFVSVYGTTIYGNTAQLGGGIYNQGYTFDMANSTISGNNSFGDSGAIDNREHMTLNHVTVANSNGRGIHHAGSYITVSNSIVAGSSNGDCSSGVTGINNNLSSDDTCVTFSIINTDPLLGDLSDNGGANYTHMPAAGSAAIDAGGNCYSGFDQIGVERIYGACDLGAVEVPQILDPHAPRPADDNYTTAWDRDLVVAAPGILANDYDPDGDRLETHLAEGPSSGHLMLNRDGSFTYRPVVGFQGVVSFTYKAWDGRTATTARVFITVTPGMHLPIANDDAFTANAGTRLYVSAPGVLANDYDLDGDALDAYLVRAPQVGSLGFHRDGSFWYDAPAGFSGQVTFVYKAAKDKTWIFKDEAVVTITVR